MLESNPPRNNQLESHRSDELGRGCKGAPFPLLHHFDTSPNTSKTHAAIEDRYRCNTLAFQVEPSGTHSRL
jgi:hypothetical protein